jgi:hypothetical protein
LHFMVRLRRTNHVNIRRRRRRRRKHGNYIGFFRVFVISCFGD